MSPLVDQPRLEELVSGKMVKHQHKWQWCKSVFFVIWKQTPSLTLVGESLLSPRPGRSSCQLFTHRVTGKENIEGVCSAEVELLLQLLYAPVGPAQTEEPILGEQDCSPCWRWLDCAICCSLTTAVIKQGSFQSWGFWRDWFVCPILPG